MLHLTAPPSVSNVHIIGVLVEGNTIKGVGDYFGGREGPSKFDWLRENIDTGLVFFVFSLVEDNIINEWEILCYTILLLSLWFCVIVW